MSRVSIPRRAAEFAANALDAPSFKGLPDYERTVSEIRSALDAKAPKPPPAPSAHPKPDRRASMKAKKRATRSVWEGIKLEVRKRSGGICELCRVRVASDVHHAFGGKNRKAMQSVESCIDVCRVCHDQIGGPDALFWATEQRQHFFRHGYFEEMAEMQKRIDLLRDRAALSAKSEEVGRG